jgi:phosphoglycerol transferase MdoB-like AlkP superfamily enzyme
VKRETVFLKLSVIVLALPILAACIFLLPFLWRDATESGGWIANSMRPILVGMYVAAVPYFVALFQTFTLLGLIDRNEAFSYGAVKVLRVIKYCALTITVIYTALLPFFYWFAERDDSPGFLVIGFIFVFAAFVIAVFAELLQKLLKRAIDMKQEIDLTV